MKNLNTLIKIFFLLAAFGATAVVFTAYKKPHRIPTAPTTDPGVVINGVKWATRNLDVGGKFVATPKDYGALFQWGRKADGHESRTSATTTTVSSTDVPRHNNFILGTPSSKYDWRSPKNDALWNAGTETAPVKAANDPSPRGWRVPTDAEFQKLLDAKRVSRMWDDSRKGYIFTDIRSGASLFLPADGYRNGTTGYHWIPGANGYYWSSRPSYGSSYYLNLRSSSAYSATLSRMYGASLRCVAE